MARLQRLELEFITADGDDLDDVLTVDEIHAAIDRAEEVSVSNYWDEGKYVDPSAGKKRKPKPKKKYRPD